MSEGIVEGKVYQLPRRLPRETSSPVAQPGSPRGKDEDEARGGNSVHLDIATSEDLHTNEDPENAREELERAAPGEPQAAADASTRPSDEGKEKTDEAPQAPAPASEVQQDETMEAAMSRADMQDLMDSFDRAFRQPQRGDVVEGQVVRIDKDGIMVDIGTKSEGIVPGHEIQEFGADALEEIKVGDTLLVYVVQTENQQGHVVLSLRRARAERGWRTAQKRFDEGLTVEAKVTDHNRGGLIVNLDGVRGFVPVSQVMGLRQDRVSDEELEKRMAEMVGKTLSLKVIEVNRGRNRLILSERQATQELRVQRKEQLLNELKDGEIRHGRVSSVCDFGAFIDLGGADGLVHLSELSWSSISHPSEVVKVGDEVDVQVLGVDREKKKIALSLRRSQPGPWTKVAEKYKVNDLVSGRITKLTTFGAFARIEDGVEGLIHVSELAEGRVAHPKNVVKEGDVVTVRIIRIDPEHRRLGLSLKQAYGEEPSAHGETVAESVETEPSSGAVPSEVLSSEVASTAEIETEETANGTEPADEAESAVERTETANEVAQSAEISPSFHSDPDVTISSLEAAAE